MRRLFRIAELTVALDSELPWSPGDQDPYRRFAVSTGNGDICLDIHWHLPEPPRPCEEILTLSSDPARAQPDCRLCRDDRGRWRIEANGGHKAFARRVAVVSPDFSWGRLFVQTSRSAPQPYPNPFCPPLDRVLFVNILARQTGMMIHACGTILDGKGYIFAGASGAGKSTMARLWSRHNGATVLGEECLIVRRKGTSHWVYGTPWVGETKITSPQGAPLAGIYFLRHAPQNTARPLPPGEAVGRLLARSYLTLYEPGTARRGLDLCLDLVQAVPAYDFGFRPDPGAVDYVRRMVR